MLSKVTPKFQYNWPVRNGGTRISYGGILMPGVTQGTDLGVLIQAATTGLGVAGRIKKDFPSTVTDTNVNGTVWNLFDVELWTPAYVDTIEYDQTTTMAVASTSTTTVTITSLENLINTGWLYATGGTGIGLLSFIAGQSGTGSCTSKTATGWDSTTTVIKILRLFHRLGAISLIAGQQDKLGTQAGAGSWTIRVMQNKFRSNGVWQYLDPTKHDNVTGLNAATAATKFFAEIVALSSLAGVLS